jgi:hypothetical protein
MARVLVGGLLVFFAVLTLVSPPEGGVPVPELVASAIAVAGVLTIAGRRFDIAVRILWALAAATFAITLIHYNVACTALYSGSNVAVAPSEVWLVCAPAWPLFSAPAATGALLVLLIGVRDGFPRSGMYASGTELGVPAPLVDRPLQVEPIDDAESAQASAGPSRQEAMANPEDPPVGRGP